ncbi:GDSL-type esterase/lipase family protein [Uliginosibacterium sp. H3]|uniref:GDSL-type esterase/lipase family protein n=1 Tax=Uliginosibacterium silvisoli TaxID=3114758 RepID=A0ABU6K2E2_9RHOO|nr:GDSL-type esterase/lipase family protein [Uliginosibacterium sp. H3]
MQPNHLAPLARLRSLALRLTLGAAVLLLNACSGTSTPTPARPTAEEAPPKSAPQFIQAHQRFLERGMQGPVDVLFLGDSITAGWSKAPDVWQRHYGAWRPANFGIGGDRIEDVQWRITHGELDNIRPRVVVLMLGTNDTGNLSGAQIAERNRVVIDTVRTRLPDTKVLLLAIFPRGPRNTEPANIDDARRRMQIIRAANDRMAAFDDGKSVRFLDIGERFMRNGLIPPEVMPDQLHPSHAGYVIWAEAMQPLFDEMMR